MKQPAEKRILVGWAVPPKTKHEFALTAAFLGFKQESHGAEFWGAVNKKFVVNITYLAPDLDQQELRTLFEAIPSALHGIFKGLLDRGYSQQEAVRLVNKIAHAPDPIAELQGLDMTRTTRTAAR